MHCTLIGRGRKCHARLRGTREHMDDKTLRIIHSPTESTSRHTRRQSVLYENNRNGKSLLQKKMHRYKILFHETAKRGRNHQHEMLFSKVDDSRDPY